MPSLRSFSRRRLAPTMIVAVAFVGASSAFADLIHNYPLNDSFADTFGGPSIVSGGGNLGSNGYTFAAGQGPNLSNALPDPGNYSIEMGFTIDQIDGYRKILDFKNLTSDNGAYNLNTEASLYNFGDGPAGAFAAGTPVVFVLTRDGATNEVAAYVDNVFQFGFTDSGNAFVFDGPNNIIQMLIDDTTTSGAEAASGFLDFVRIYNSPIPEPSSAGLVVLGLAGLGMVRQWRRQRANAN